MPDDAKIEGARLKEVLDSALRLFGDAGRQYIMDDLAAHGIRFERGVFYNLSDVQKALSILGEDGASLVIERVRYEISRS